MLPAREREAQRHEQRPALAPARGGDRGRPGAPAARVPGLRRQQVGGGGENFAAIVGGHTQATVLSSSEYQSYKANGIRALAYSGPQRLALEPEIPTLKELGLGVEFCIENFWFAQKGAPREAIEGFAGALEKAMATEEVKAFLERQAQTGQFMRGDAYATHLDGVFRAIEPVARAAAPQQ